MSENQTTRRRFLQWGAGTIASALTAASWSRVYGANEKLQLASVGTAGQAWHDLTSVAASPKVQVTALCDVDESEQRLGRAAKQFSAAKTYSDFRKLLDDGKLFDAVIVAIPDHMHAVVALPAMQLGKHVYCEKPLTHSIFEARQMQLAAAKYKVVTQMGNQIQSHEAYRTAVALVRGGGFGKIKEVFSWQAGKMGWLLADDRPEGADKIPEKLHWDLWLGAARERPFKANIYHSFNWRGRQDFSNGQLGDFGCHILDPVFMALKLTAPTSVSADAPPINGEVWTKWSTVTWEFPGTEFTAEKTLKVTWFDGEGKMPPREKLGLAESVKLPGSGSLLIGEKGTLLIPHVAAPKPLPEEKFADKKIETVAGVNHYTGWADACRGEGKTTSSFDYSGNLTETVLLGTIAIRVPGTMLKWDAKELQFTNSRMATSMVKKSYRKGWEPKWV